MVMIISGIAVVPGRNAYVDRDGTKYGIAIHNTSNDGSAADEAHYAQTRQDGISAHFYADAVQVIQSLNTDARAGHAGSSTGNENAVAVEITGVNSWPREVWLRQVDWAELGHVLAQVCRRYGIAVRRASVTEMKTNPKVRAFYSHDDMRRAWGGTTHTDPGPDFPWDRLFEAVNTALNPEGEEMADFDKSAPNAWTQARRVEALLNNANVVDDEVTSAETNKLAAAIGDIRTQLETVVRMLTDGTPPAGSALTDADVERIAKAVVDEEHRRSAE